MSVELTKALDILAGEARDFGEAIDAELEVAAAGDDTERAQASERAAEFWRILFADLEAGLTAADSARAIERAAAERARALRDHFAAQVAAAERRIDIIDEAVRRALVAAAAAGGKETIRVRGARVNVGLVHKPAAVVLEIPVELLPRAFQRVKIEPDKRAIAEALKAGEEVTGAKLERGLRVDWRGA
ncbi:MAG: hypothetical protein EKK60_16880 [Gordonia sp. (in: high G+C Gram-positive bacteria)]|nr:MAG: hypothetical protein EKK60_16880 [Gordonia sp. (in: high G+C Gram-positive bacteria)]